jgi:hypothetical protein
MTDRQREQTLSWINNWRELGPLLEDLRRASLKNVSTAESIEAFTLAYKSARLHCPRRTTSGLIEQQRWFRRGRP